MSSFSDAYNKLNPEQQSAVDTIEGPVLVVAGPGTGKTQVLAMRIANILEKTDSKPSNILALTFTDSAAQNMKERVVELIGHEGYYAHITTFHSFCSAVINANPEYFPIDRDSTALSDLERFDIFQSLILEAKLEALKPLNRPLYYLKDIMKAISDLKREGVEPDRFEEIIKTDFATEPEKATKATLLKFQKDKAKNTELLELYRAYEARLRKSLRFDFDDMISLVIAAFQEHEVLLSQYQEQFLYFLVDEYQDTNAAQNKVLTLLSSFWGEQANVFAVGDPHQAIYRFQGASLENIYGFLDHYSEAKVVTLITGYRCPQPIYSAAHALIGNNKLTSLSGHEDLTTALGQELQAVSKIKALPLCIATPSEELQYAALAHDIARKVAEGVALNDISVLYRNNGEASSIAAALQAWQLPFAIERGGNVLDDKILLQFITLLQVISQLRSGGEAHELYECLSFEWLKLNPATVWRVGRAAGKTNHTLFEFLEKGTDEVIKADKELTLLELEPIYTFIEKLKLWGVSEKKLPFPEWFTTVLNESGYLPWVLENEARSEMLIAVNTLFSEIKANSYSNHKLSLEDVLNNIAVMQEHNLSLSPDEVLVRKDAIHLSTAHKAKGREWDHVYLVNVKDGLWGNKTQRQLITLPESILRYTDVDSKEKNEDDRRLFYVALTRARKTCTLMYPETTIRSGRTRQEVRSMFLSEIDKFLEMNTPASLDAVFSNPEEHVIKLLTPSPIRVLKSDERVFFEQLVKDFSLSVTALNKYLADPESFVTDVLLKVPKAKAAPMVFGSAIHGALEHVFRSVQETGEKPPIKEVTSVFIKKFDKELIADDERERRIKFGSEILESYYAQEDRFEVQPIYIERFFGSGLSKTVLGDITLTGRIDRIDWHDISKKTARVVDYKTGRIRSVNDIEGKTVSAGLSEREQSLPESIRGPYKRQLLFYKLLTELDRTFVPTVVEGVFDFIEPNKTNGKQVSHTFALDDSAVNDLKELIKEVMGEIRGLEFLG